MNDEKHIIVTTSAFELRSMARSKLNSNWLKMFACLLCYFVIVNFVDIVILVLQPGKMYINLVYTQFTLLPWLAILYVLVIKEPMNLGIIDIMLRLIRSEKLTFSVIFSGFKNVLKTVGLALSKFVLIFWPLILVMVCAFSYIFVFATSDNVDGAIIYNHWIFSIFMVFIIVAFAVAVVYAVITGLRYSLVYYILADDRKKSIISCLSESSDLMHMNKSKMLCLILSFSGWYLAVIIPTLLIVWTMENIFPVANLQIISTPAAFTIMIGMIPFIIVSEYMIAAVTEFYKIIKA